MNILYAPWRDEYNGQENAQQDTCVFCVQLTYNRDEEYFILARYKRTFVMLNLYPYNAGHLLILPLAHTAHLEDLAPDTAHELSALIIQSTRILKEKLKAQGINIGMNLGKAAGAGIPSHLHAHVLPRWQGDTNFLPTLAQAKQVSKDLSKIYGELRPFFQNLSIN